MPLSTGGLKGTSTDAQSTFAGNVAIVAVVKKHGSDQQSWALVGVVELENESKHTSSTQGSAPGDSESPRSITVDLPIGEALSNSAYQYNAEIE